MKRKCRIVTMKPCHGVCGAMGRHDDSNEPYFCKDCESKQNLQRVKDAAPEMYQTLLDAMSLIMSMMYGSCLLRVKKQSPKRKEWTNEKETRRLSRK